MRVADRPHANPPIMAIVWETIAEALKEEGLKIRIQNENLRLEIDRA